MENGSKVSPPLNKDSQGRLKLFGLHPLSLLLGFVPGVILAGIIWFGFSPGETLSLSENKELAQLSCALQGDLEASEDIPEENRSEVLAYLKFKQIKQSHIPTGVPAVYGEELNISFDEVQDAINKVRVFGPTYGLKGKKITLEGQDLERYVHIGSRIACEYCCGVKTLVREDGSAACGCAHSIMMRGLSAYLIKNHPQLSNEQILGELADWKITYFPKQTLSAKLLELERAGEEGIKELLEEFPEFLPQMVGGC